MNRARRNPERRLRLVGGGGQRAPRDGAGRWEMQFEVNGITYRATIAFDLSRSEYGKAVVRAKTNGHRPIVLTGAVAFHTGLIDVRVANVFDELLPAGVSSVTQARAIQHAINVRLPPPYGTAARAGISASEQHTWETTRSVGDRYREETPRGKIALAIRKDLVNLVKRRSLPAGTKFTSQTSGNTIHIIVTDAPFRVLDAEWARAAVAGRMRYSGTGYRYTPRAQQLLEVIEAVAARYNKAERHSASDYSNVRFYFEAKISGELEDRDFHATTGMHMNDRRIPW